jgi:hypothetical protein
MVGTTIATCAQCAFDLRQDTLQDAATDEQIDRQSKFELTVRNGYTLIAGHSDLHSLAFFGGLRVLVKFFMSNGIAGKVGRTQKARFVEWLDIEPRKVLLDRVFVCLANWPTEFIRSCATVKAPYTALTADRAHLPWWIYRVCTESIRRDQPQLSNEEVAHIKRHVVETQGTFTLQAATRMTGRDLSRWVASPAKLHTWADFQTVLEKLEEEIDRTKGIDQLDLMRDAVMLVMAKVLHLTQGKLRQLEVTTNWVLAVEQYSMPSIQKSPLGSDDLQKWIDWYRICVRPHYPGAKETAWLYLCRGRNGRMSDTLVGARLIAHLRSGGTHEPFKSYSEWVRAEAENLPRSNVRISK